MVETACSKAALQSDFYTYVQPTAPCFSAKPEKCVDSKMLYLNSPPAAISKTCEQSAASHLEELTFVVRVMNRAVYFQEWGRNTLYWALSL